MISKRNISINITKPIDRLTINIGKKSMLTSLNILKKMPNIPTPVFNKPIKI